MPRPQFLSWLVLTIFFTSAGCGDSFPNAGAPVPASGIVRLRGLPIQNGTIVFSPNPEFGGDAEVVQTGLHADGSFLLSQMAVAGIRPGFYRIAVSGVTSSGYATPSRYKDPTTSGLRCTIEPNQPLQLFIELE
jgi:hypothetical protein